MCWDTKSSALGQGETSHIDKLAPECARSIQLVLTMVPNPMCALQNTRQARRLPAGQRSPGMENISVLGGGRPCGSPTVPLWDSEESVSLGTAITHIARVLHSRALHAEHLCALCALSARPPLALLDFLPWGQCWDTKTNACSLGFSPMGQCCFKYQDQRPGLACNTANAHSLVQAE